MSLDKFQYMFMIFRLDRFFLDEKDIFTFLFGVFLIAVHFLSIPIEPFRFGSLVVLFLFLVITRSMKNSISFRGYVVIALFGFVFATFLSPYGLGIYLFIASIIYSKWGRV